MTHIRVIAQYGFLPNNVKIINNIVGQYTETHFIHHNSIKYIRLKLTNERIFIVHIS